MSDDDDDHHPAAAVVLRAVQAGVSADELRRVIDGCVSPSGRRSWSRRRDALNYCDGDERCPLTVAHRRKRADLVAVLLEAGANADAAFDHRGGAALLLAIHYDLPDTLRFLLRSGRHAVDERLWYWGSDSTPSRYYPALDWCLPVHAAVVPPVWSGVREPVRKRVPRLGLIDVLVREFAADIDARDSWDKTPVQRLANTRGLPAPAARQALDALLAHGAKIEAKGMSLTPLHLAARANADLVAPLLSRGASANVLNYSRDSPLMFACRQQGPLARHGVLALLRASSPATRRAVNYDGLTAVDILLRNHDPSQRWVRQALGKLLQSGVPVRFEPGAHAAGCLQTMARAAAGLELDAAAAAREGARQWWRTHDMMVQLAFDHQEPREAQEGVRRREARVAELERALAGEG